MSCLTTTSDAASAFSVACRSPASQWKMRLSFLPGLSVRRTGRARLQRLEGVHDDGQRVVLDLHRLDAVGRGVAVGRDDGRDLLRLVHDLLGRQHHLRVRHQRRHPVQVVLLERLAGDDGEHARDLQRLRWVDLHDLRVREGAPHDVHVEHPRQLDVVHVVALAAEEARVFLALDRVAHAADFG